MAQLIFLITLLLKILKNVIYFFLFYFILFYFILHTCILLHSNLFYFTFKYSF